MFFKKQKSGVGLDIRSNAVICTEVAAIPGGYRLIGLGEAPLTETTPEAKIEAINKAFENGNIKPKSINVALSGPATVVRHIELPSMTEEELNNAIIYEIEKYIPFKVSEVEFDFQALEPRGGRGESVMVLLVAAKKEEVEEVLSLEEKIGCKIGVIDVQPLAIMNCFEGCGPDLEEGEIISLIDIGWESASLNILWDKTPYLTREMPIKGVIKEALGKKIDLSAEEPNEVKSALMELIGEVRLSFDHFESGAGKSVSAIYLSGACAALKGLDGFLAKQMGIDVKLWKLEEHLEVDKEKVNAETLTRLSGSLAVSVGLAL